jgi:transposase
LDTMTTIRHLYHFQKQKIRRIAEEFGLSRNTVRKIVQTEDVGKKYTRTKQVAPRLEPYQEALQGLLETSEKLPRKQQYTARKLYETLRSQGYAGAYDSIQRYVKAWKKRRGKLQNQAYIPCVFAPGEAYQFDWSDETAEIGGIVQRIKVAHVRLCFSRYFLCIAYPNERQEMFFDAHTRAFEHFEGNAGCGIYDNLKTGIKVICIGKEREYNRAFLMMLGHYCIDPRACTPGAGWEKGRVENQVETVRKQLFVPIPRFESFEALNDWLRMRCEQLANTFKHPEQKDKTVAEVFESQEKDQLRRFSVPFDGGVAHTVSVSKTCLVRFDRNCYSVDCHYAGRVVTLKAYADRIVVVADNAIIAEHLRLFGRDQACYVWWHYLAALERKPGALRNGAPFKDMDLPPPIQQVRMHLDRRTGGDKEFVKILQAIRTEGLETVTGACELALEEKTVSADAILNLISRLRPNPVPDAVATPEKLSLKLPPLADCARYDILLSRSAGGQA